jgi:hypothetical protein
MYPSAVSIKSDIGYDKKGIFIEVMIVNTSNSNITFFGQRLPWENPESVKCFVTIESEWVVGKPAQKIASYGKTFTIQPNSEISGRFYLKDVLSDEQHDKIIGLELFQIAWVWDGGYIDANFQSISATGGGVHWFDSSQLKY